MNIYACKADVQPAESKGDRPYGNGKKSGSSKERFAEVVVCNFVCCFETFFVFVFDRLDGQVMHTDHFSSLVCIVFSIPHINSRKRDFSQYKAVECQAECSKIKSCNRRTEHSVGSDEKGV